MKRTLTKQDIPHRVINCQEDNEPRLEFNNQTPTEFVIDNFTREMPVVYIQHFKNDVLNDEESWWFSGVNTDKLAVLADEYHLLNY